MRKPRLRHILDLAAREMLFRIACRHRQGDKPNILMFCSRRGGSTWLLNTLASHPGMRYIGRPFITILRSRFHHRVPDLAAAAGYTGPRYKFHQVVGFTGDDEERFRELARDIIDCRIHVYPTLAFRAPYFNRVTDRVIFQMTSGQPLCEWFDEHFNVATLVQFRHPIPTALSTMHEGWRHECRDFLHHQGFVETHLTGAQVDMARHVLEEGSPLAMHVLDWSLKMLVPFKALQSGRHPDWTTVSYEQTVVQPDHVLEALGERLQLPDVEAMKQQVRRPSRTVSGETAARTDDQSYLRTRWRSKVGPEDERSLLDIPQSLGITIYQVGEDDPAPEFLL